MSKDGIDIVSLTDLVKSFFNGLYKTHVFPDILTISVSRPKLCSIKVNIPDELDLSSYSAYKNQLTKYRLLKMFIFHENNLCDPTGLLNHYVVYILESSEKWYKYDDENVLEVKKGLVDEKLLYGCIYTYEKISK